MSHRKLRAIYKQLTDKVDESKEAALFEVKELKNDLNELQRHFSGRKKITDIQPDDVLRSAYEIAARMRDVVKRQEILAEMEDVAAEDEALEYLDSRGAKLLTRPAGWHFQTARERFLLHAEDPVQAAAELRKLLAAGKRLKKPAKKKAKPKAAPAKPAPKPKADAEASKRPKKKTTAAKKTAQDPLLDEPPVATASKKKKAPAAKDAAPAKAAKKTSKPKTDKAATAKKSGANAAGTAKKKK